MQLDDSTVMNLKLAYVLVIDGINGLDHIGIGLGLSGHMISILLVS